VNEIIVVFILNKILEVPSDGGVYGGYVV